MTECVVCIEGESVELLSETGLQAVVIAAGVGAEFVDIAEALVEGLRVGIGLETSGADGLIAVEANLKRLVEAASADIADANGAVRI